MHQMKQIPNPFCWCLEINRFKDNNFGSSSFRHKPSIKKVLQTAATFWEDAVPRAAAVVRVKGCPVLLLPGLLRGASRGRGESNSPLMPLLVPPVLPTSVAVRKRLCSVDFRENDR